MQSQPIHAVSAPVFLGEPTRPPPEGAENPSTESDSVLIADAWTPCTPGGVEAFDDHAKAARSGVAGFRKGLRRTALTLLGCVTLLGQGEQCRVDRRFVSPSATLLTFWEAMRVGDAEGVWECFVEGRNDLPLPGMLWFLPPTDKLSLAEFRALSVSAGRVLVRYEVHFVPRGQDEERSFTTGDELVRMRGQWRIARPIGSLNVPIGDLPPRTVDS